MRLRVGEEVVEKVVASKLFRKTRKFDCGYFLSDKVELEKLMSLEKIYRKKIVSRVSRDWGRC